jgi:hypothetical protein
MYLQTLSPPTVSSSEWATALFSARDIKTVCWEWATGELEQSSRSPGAPDEQGPVLDRLAYPESLDDAGLPSYWAR